MFDLDFDRPIARPSIRRYDNIILKVEDMITFGFSASKRQRYLRLIVLSEVALHRLSRRNKLFGSDHILTREAGRLMSNITMALAEYLGY